MALPAVVAAAAAVAAATPAVIEAVKRIIDEFERSVILEVINLTDETFTVEGAHHDSGAFGTAPPPVIKPRETVVFSSRSNTPGQGAVGNLRLVSTDLWLGMSWHNAFVGSNALRGSENGTRGPEFETYATAGPGNKNAAFRYVVYYSNLRRMEQMYGAVRPTWFEANQEPLGKAFLAAETAATSWAANRIDLFHVKVGDATRLTHRWWHGGPWRSEDIGETRERIGLAATSQGPDRLDIFYQLHGELYHIDYHGGSWTEKNLGGNLYRYHGPAAASWADGRLDVFYRGPNNQLIQRYCENGNWSGEVELAQGVAGKPTVASWGPGRLDVFFRDENHRLRQVWFHNGWKEFVLGEGIQADPASVSWGPGRVDVFYPGPSRELLQRFYDNGNWSGEVNLGGVNVRANLSACSWAPRRLDLFYNDPLTAVQHHWYQG